MVDKWVAIEVIGGPQSLLGKVARIRLQKDNHSAIDLEQNDFRTLGRIEFMKMFGDFEGLEKLSRIHIEILDYHNQGKLRIEDQSSTNGTEFPNGNQGMQVVAILAGVVKIKASWSDDNFTIMPEEFIIAAPRLSETGYSPPQVMDDESLMNLISSEIKKVCQKTGMSWQLRRGWNVREKPVEQSTLSEYQWKIIPPGGDKYQTSENPLVPGEHYDKEISFGAYYLIFTRNGELFFEHSGSYVGILGPHHDCHQYVVQGGFWNTSNKHESPYNNFEISEWLMQWITKYPPSYYSMT